jgi:hypothetical protein
MDSRREPVDAVGIALVERAVGLGLYELVRRGERS